MGTPLKRYQIASVWRGENTQKGRYREFVQCDFDTIGTQSILADIETALVIHDLFVALGCEKFKIHINNRKILTGLLSSLGLSTHTSNLLRVLDKLPKIGREKVVSEMLEIEGTNKEHIDSLLALSEIGGTNEEMLHQASSLATNNPIFGEGVGELTELLSGVAAAGIPNSRVHLDFSIARGLDYYTGSIFETFLDALPEIGSVCSGGRYDHLAETYTKTELPGVGASLGLDRLHAAMQEIGATGVRSATAEIFVVYFDAKRRDDYLRIASQLRASGLRVELYGEAKKIAQQLKYANRRGHHIAVIAGSEELERGTCQIKDLRTGETEETSLRDGYEALISKVKQKLAL